MPNEKIFMILTNGFDPDVRVFKEAKYLVDLKYEVEILCWDRKCEYKNKSIEKIEGVTINRFHIKSIPGSGMKQLIPFVKYILAVKKYLKKQEYKWVHCHDFDGMITGYFATLFKNKKLVFDMHELYKSKFRVLLQFFIKKAKKLIYVNDEQLKVLKIKDDKKLVYLPNYPEEKKYLPIEKVKKDKTTVNYVGCLRDYDSLKTLAELSKTREDLKIGLYGTGVCYDKLLQEYKNSNVEIFGKYNGIEESGEIYQNTNILYCVYNPEVKNWRNAYPVKLYEAIITETPIIVSKDTKAGKFVEDNKIGESVEYGNSEELNHEIEKILNHYEHYVSNLQKIKNQYSWENVVKNLKQIYKCEEK